jgi:hypothetical protein
VNYSFVRDNPASLDPLVCPERPQVYLHSILAPLTNNQYMARRVSLLRRHQLDCGAVNFSRSIGVYHQNRELAVAVDKDTIMAVNEHCANSLSVDSPASSIVCNVSKVSAPVICSWVVPQLFGAEGLVLRLCVYLCCICVWDQLQ